MTQFAKLRFPLLFLLICSLGSAAQSVSVVSTDDAASGKIQYPETRKVDQVDDYFGTKIADPYRWLENGDSEETHAWIAAQNKVTFAYLSQIPVREQIKARLTKLWNFERYTVPVKRGGRYFYARNNGLQNQNVLYMAASLTAAPKMLLDPNTLSADGTVALSNFTVSNDGKLMVYGLAASGSDWNEFRVRDLETGADLPDRVQWVKFSGASFSKDGKGFFYSRYDEPKEATKLQDANFFHKLYYHRIGTPQSEDALIYQRPDQKDWLFRGRVTDDGRYLVVHISAGSSSKNRVYYEDLTKPDAEVVPLLDESDAAYDFLDNDGPIFWFQTDWKAARSQVIAIDLRQPQRENWKAIIPEAAETMDSADVVDNRFVVSYLKDARAQVKIFDLNGKFIREVALPGIGAVDGLNGRRNDKETFYSFASFTTPLTVYRYNMATGKSTIFRQPKADFNPANYETKQVFYTSKDGTRVPMFISYKKGLKLNGLNPTYLYGYGGFNISSTPSFKVENLVWMEMGGVYALANLRGGGEYGEEWHQAGAKLRKQNVFDDFIAAAEWLISNRYTSTPKLAIGGRSNGGLLVGAVLTQRPDLFGAALPGVGVMDMLRFHKFTIGWAWTSDYGSSDDPEQFKALFAYSPLHNLKRGTKYPPTLITTADHDDRVVPAHSFKFASAMQAAQAGPAPVLIRIETKAGHGAGKPVSKQIEEMADGFGFLLHALHADGNVTASAQEK